MGIHRSQVLDAAQQLELPTIVHDPGPVPGDLSMQRVDLIDDADAFYRSSADLFHLALHPEHRAHGLNVLLECSGTEPILILCEKPMADPSRPMDCAAMVDSIQRSQATVSVRFSRVV